jgi:alpha-1,2-mannosyltransferase
VFTIDSLAYGRLTLVPWNIVSYNVFGGEKRGPDLYGTEPWSYYFLNLALNFNLVAPLALASLPALFMTHTIDYKRLGITRHAADESSPYTLLTLRLVPVYVWIGLLTAQPHKEERFMYPIYPLLCFNAAVTVHLFRGWLETIYIKVTGSPYKVALFALLKLLKLIQGVQASRTSAFRLTTFNIVLVISFISLSRIVALYQYYHAPLDIAFHMEYVELPRLLNVTGLLLSADTPSPSKDNHTSTFQTPRNQLHRSSREDELPAVDFTPLKEVLGGVRLCLGKEWYRFPGHFLVPEGVEVRWIKSEFNGLLPGRFVPSSGKGWPWGLWPWDGMRVQPEGVNDLNKEDSGVHVSVPPTSTAAQQHRD